MADLRVEIHGTTFQNPVLVASGTFGYGLEVSEAYPVEELGGICTKGLTLRPRLGNPPPRLKETPCGLLNSIGLENIGWDAFVEQKLPALRNLEGPRIVVNLNGETEEEYLELVEKADATEGVDVLEINVSCPNVKKGGMEFGRDPKALERLVRKLRKQTSKPLWIKLTPNFVDIVAEAKAAEQGGADAVSLINTLLGTSVDLRTRTYVPGFGHGGLSGPAIYPFALYCVREVAKAVSIPVVGIGGIANPEIALQFLLAGASLIQIGTAAMIDPRTPFQVIEGIQRYLDTHGYASVGEIIGIAHAPDTPPRPPRTN